MRDRALLLRLSLSASSAAAAAAEALAWHLVPVFVAALTSAVYDTSALQPSLWAAVDRIRAHVDGETTALTLKQTSGDL